MARPNARREERLTAGEQRIAHSTTLAKSEARALRDLAAAQNELAHAQADMAGAEREIAACEAVHISDARDARDVNRLLTGVLA